MWTIFEKLDCILSRSDLRKLLLLLIPITVVSMLEVLGVYSILPFMTVVAEPDVVETDARYQWLMSYFGFSSRRSLMIWMGIAVLAIQLVIGVTSVFTSWLTQRLIWNFAHRVSMKLLLHYARQPYEFFLNTNSAGMVKKVLGDIQSLVTGVLLVGCQFVVNILKSIAILVFLLFVDFYLALTAFAVFGGIYMFIHVFRHRYLNQLGKQRLKFLKARVKAFTETIGGMKTLQISGALGYFVRRFKVASRKYSDIQPKVHLYSVVPRKIVEFAAIGGIIILIVIQLMSGQDLSKVIPVLSVFALATFKLLPALGTAFAQAASLSHNLPVVDELHEDMHQLEQLLKPIEEFAAADPLEFEGSIVLDNVSYQYASSGMPALHNIGLEIHKGQKYAFVGPTGCGKSTLVDVLVGLLRPTAGQLRIDSANITTDNVYGWQKIIAYVPQDVFLFDDTIAANIALGVESKQIDWERLKYAARFAQVEEFIETEFREGYDTVVGEKGARLSGGQRQRIGLARAFYRQPSVLFLDEATSALDSVTEQAVLSAIEQEMPDVTVIMVAHRLTSTRFCDSIVLINEGRIASCGSFDQLMQTSHQFREMVEITD